MIVISPSGDTHISFAVSLNVSRTFRAIIIASDIVFLEEGVDNEFVGFCRHGVQIGDFCDIRREGFKSGCLSAYKPINRAVEQICDPPNGKEIWPTL